MALYRQKRQKNKRGRSAYSDDYRTTKASRAIKAAVIVAILLALFAVGFFLVEPWLERRYAGGEENAQTQSGEEFTLPDDANSGA